MIGGGDGAFIGAVHRMAAALDGTIEFVCGAFSSKPEKSITFGVKLGLSPNRVYSDYEEMILAEKAIPEHERMDFVSIVTPNHVHAAPAIFALQNGFHVICDKPLCYNLEEATAVKNAVEKSGCLFALTYNYTGYPMVKQAKAMIANGDLGTIRKVVVEYAQGWLATFLEGEKQKQASWRTDPGKSGIAGSLGDIGTHAENLAEYITGLKIKRLCADLNIVVAGRKLDDDSNILLKFDNGANGILFASQVAAGEENNLNIRIWGEKGGLEWSQQEPNTLIAKWLAAPTQIYRTGTPHLYPQAATASRIPAGHPEGYIEAFATIYKSFAAAITQYKNGTPIANIKTDFPTVDDGVRGMQFIYNAVASSSKGSIWVDC
ncbi:MAG: Gfo/Idh/MocA family oxidoreductase [Saprospiraceae bacterium]|nr:Gfo/Idh/MocA family oxidoreductase [Saprospiraceae bacterium]